jgi:vacuolar-type H+-ATPase subunit H
MNKEKIISLLFVVLAGGAGFAAGFFVNKKKNEAKADKEIKDVKEVYEKYIAELREQADHSSVPTTKDPDKHFDRTTLDQQKETSSGTKPFSPEEKQEYKDYSAPYRSKQKPKGKEKPGNGGVANDMSAPYVISPEDFSDSEYNNAVTLYFFEKDKILSDKDYNILSDPIAIVGGAALQSFGRYEDDAVYVRDDKNKVDYEILLKHESFSDEAPYPSHMKESEPDEDDDGPKDE